MQYIMYEQGEELPIFDIGLVPLIYGDLGNCVKFAKRYAMKRKKVVNVYEGKKDSDTYDFLLSINYTDYTP